MIKSYRVLMTVHQTTDFANGMPVSTTEASIRRAVESVFRGHKFLAIAIHDCDEKQSKGDADDQK